MPLFSAERTVSRQWRPRWSEIVLSWCLIAVVALSILLYTNLHVIRTSASSARSYYLPLAAVNGALSSLTCTLNSSLRFSLELNFSKHIKGTLWPALISWSILKCWKENSIQVKMRDPAYNWVILEKNWHQQSLESLFVLTTSEQLRKPSRAVRHLLCLSKGAPVP